MYFNRNAGQMPAALQAALAQRLASQPNRNWGGGNPAAVPAWHPAAQRPAWNPMGNTPVARAALAQRMGNPAMQRPMVPQGVVPQGAMAQSLMPQRYPRPMQPLANPVGATNAPIPSVPGMEALSGNRRARFAQGSYGSY